MTGNRAPMSGPYIGSKTRLPQAERSRFPHRVKRRTEGRRKSVLCPYPDGVCLFRILRTVRSREERTPVRQRRGAATEDLLNRATSLPWFQGVRERAAG